MSKHHKKIPRNDHHLLWPRRIWSVGKAARLRHAFVEHIDWELHERLHATIEPMPMPPEEAIEHALELLEQDGESIRSMTIDEKMDWLQKAIPDQAFDEAMQAQRDFFDN